jgi:hypothetical protein
VQAAEIPPVEHAFVTSYKREFGFVLEVGGLFVSLRVK